MSEDLDKTRADAAGKNRFVVFRLNDAAFAAPLDKVIRAHRMVALFPVPEAPAHVAGMVYICGEAFPVLDLKRCFGFGSRPPAIDDRLLEFRAGGRTVVGIVDEVQDVLEAAPEQLAPADKAVAGSGGLIAVIRRKDEIIQVIDLDTLEDKVESP